MTISTMKPALGDTRVRRTSTWLVIQTLCLWLGVVGATATTTAATSVQGSPGAQTLLTATQDDVNWVLPAKSYAGNRFTALTLIDKSIFSNSGGNGFTGIAYPARYRSSGVMTLIVTQDGGVSEKDLGPNTANIAGAMTTYHADGTWSPADADAGRPGPPSPEGALSADASPSGRPLPQLGKQSAQMRIAVALAKTEI